MTLVGTIEVSTVECDKELAARESKPSAFVDFIGWLGRQGWRFCSLAVDDRFYPVDDALVMRLLPDPPDGGSQEIGMWLDDLPGLQLCYHRESNWSELTYAPHRFAAEHPDYWPEGWYPINKGVEPILADYYGIDLAQSSRERAAILAAIRKMQGL